MKARSNEVVESSIKRLARTIPYIRRAHDRGHAMRKHIAQPEEENASLMRTVASNQNETVRATSETKEIAGQGQEQRDHPRPTCATLPCCTFHSDSRASIREKCRRVPANRDARPEGVDSIKPTLPQTKLIWRPDARCGWCSGTHQPLPCPALAG